MGGRCVHSQITTGGGGGGGGKITGREVIEGKGEKAMRQYLKKPCSSI